MNILVLNGSPKAKSDTFRLTDAFLKGVRKTGEHNITIIDVIKQKSRHAAAASAAGKEVTATA